MVLEKEVFMKQRKKKTIKPHKDFHKNKELLDKIFGGDDTDLPLSFSNLLESDDKVCSPTRLVIRGTD